MERAKFESAMGGVVSNETWHAIEAVRINWLGDYNDSYMQALVEGLGLEPVVELGGILKDYLAEVKREHESAMEVARLRSELEDTQTARDAAVDERDISGRALKEVGDRLDARIREVNDLIGKNGLLKAERDVSRKAVEIKEAERKNACDALSEKNKTIDMLNHRIGKMEEELRLTSEHLETCAVKQRAPYTVSYTGGNNELHAECESISEVFYVMGDLSAAFVFAFDEDRLMHELVRMDGKIEAMVEDRGVWRISKC